MGCISDPFVMLMIFHFAHVVLPAGIIVDGFPSTQEGVQSTQKDLRLY
jgi:hypothetical protein